MHLTLGTILIVSLLVLLSVASWAEIVSAARRLRGALHEAEGRAQYDSLDLLVAETELYDAEARLAEVARAFRDDLFRSPGRIPLAGIRPADLETLRILLDQKIEEETRALTRDVWRLAAIATVGPLLGLLGTVSGVMGTFVAIQSSGSANLAAVAPGVSEALVTTIAGLLVAIPAAVAHQWIHARTEGVESSLCAFAADLTRIVASEMRSV